MRHPKSLLNSYEKSSVLEYKEADRCAKYYAERLLRLTPVFNRAVAKEKTRSCFGSDAFGPKRPACAVCVVRRLCVTAFLE